ncbi:SspB family protein [Rhodopila sp.]|uniref:SspB family protein n=1 Tax=Rhodopila sp. TaxID=2480087 RepID=UPI003D0A280B
MEDDQQQRPDSLLPYETWIAQALRHVVAQAIEHVAAAGLPGGHHFYLTFRTDHPGVQIPPRVAAQYPNEMTIVLQHQFWDLTFNRATQTIGVGLSFGGVPSRLVIPLDAVVEFADPHIRYGLRFQPADPAMTVPRTASPDSQPEGGEAPSGEDPGTAPGDAAAKGSEPAQVVSLDAFRRRSPQD